MALYEKACREAGNVFRILFNSWVRVPATAFAFCQTISRSAASPSVQTALQPAVLRVGEDGFVALEKKSQRVSPKFEESLRRSSPRTDFTAISRKFRIEEPNVNGAPPLGWISNLGLVEHLWK